ncbi:SSU ribosomal protein S9P [Pluteus cervinus]|uniref:SSU ribosomal protein S9P n=1 Tax=Pluteus cervinus TaxID=181527 RepID=A0ACD3BA76_9AGAR|nr:SSU ribosomal protein S9P [Pluteus cervinus]
MSLFRHSLRCFAHRSYSTTRPFVPPAQLHALNQGFRAPQSFHPADGGGPRRMKRKGRREGDDDAATAFEEPGDRSRAKAPPSSPSFYTGRAIYYDQVIQLQTAISHARSALTTLQLLPLPSFARESLPHLRAVWKDQAEMTTDFQSKMTTSRYRKVTSLLNELNDYLRIASTAGCTDLAAAIGQIVTMFESGKKDAFLARGKRKTVPLDSYGRSYTLGKRKTSSARVWMIPVQEAAQAPQPQEPESIEEIFGIANTPQVTTTSTILVNNIPLAEYFPLPADRERIVRPLKVAGVLGAYNVFALTRGGGTTGQSGALAHGIAKGLAAHEPELEVLLRRAKLMRRDPRMVERKKTGMAKARKRYTWVKR